MNTLALKQAIRNLTNRKNNSLVSIAGLAIAFTAVFHIYSFVHFETGYDAQYKNADRIYRISGDIVGAENTSTHAILGPLLGPKMKEEFPAVEEFTRLIPIRQPIMMEVNESKINIEEAYTADASVIDIFTLDFVFGDKNSALKQPAEVIINQSLSEKLFGYENPVGESLMKDGEPLKIVGVIQDAPENTHHKLNVLFSMGNRFQNMEGIPEVRISEGYWMPSTYLFILLAPHAKMEDITDSFDPFYEKHMAHFGKSINARFVPVPITIKELHFSRHMSYDYPKGTRTYIYIFTITAIFILLIAGLNYCNLLISQNLIHSKNIGIRKIIGITPQGLYFQFFINSLVFVGAALFIAIWFYLLSQPIVNQLSGMQVPSPSYTLLIVFSFTILVVLSFLVTFIPFAGQYRKNGLHMLLRYQGPPNAVSLLKFGKTSTIVQISLSIMLIIAVFAGSRQVNFLLNKDVGFDTDNVVILKLINPGNHETDLRSLRQNLLSRPGIEQVAYSKYAPGDVMGSSHFQIERSGQKVTKIVNSIGIDYEYIPLMGMEFNEGRNFSPHFADDGYRSVIVNEAFVDFCGFTGNITGQQIDGTTIIGVLRNVCMNSLHNPAEPIVFFLGEQTGGYLNIKFLSGSDITKAIGLIQDEWNSYFNDWPIDIQFLDDRIRMLYAGDRNKNKLAAIMTIICMLISLMGLYNISLLITKQKTKEIGIRKVNGARISEVLVMLNKDFVKWVAIAFVVATPLAWYAMNKWLENFAYKTELSWWIFALAGLLALGIALVTVSFQSWKAATRNPVESLRYE